MSVLILVVLVWGQWAHASPSAQRVAFFIPDDTPFWNRVVLFAESAARDLSIELTVFDADADRYQMQSQFDIALNSESYEAAIFPNFLKTAPGFLEKCQESRTPCVLFNSAISGDSPYPSAPTPDTPYWIAQLIPDDRGSSLSMTEHLLREAVLRFDEDQVTVAGVNGYRSDGPAIMREEGLRAATASAPNAELSQVFYTDWGKEDARFRTQGLLKRYPGIDVIWSANYRTTNGILEALDSAGLRPGREVLVNSYDISPEALRQVEQGLVEVTAGGHYVEGAWAVVIAHDYLATGGLQGSSPVFHTPLLEVTQHNVSVVQRVLSQIEDHPKTLNRVDFAVFSRLDNPRRDGYQFSLRAVLEAYESEWVLAP